MPSDVRVSRMRHGVTGENRETPPGAALASWTAVRPPPTRAIAVSDPTATVRRVLLRIQAQTFVRIPSSWLFPPARDRPFIGAILRILKNGYGLSRSPQDRRPTPPMKEAPTTRQAST